MRAYLVAALFFLIVASGLASAISVVSSPQADIAPNTKPTPAMRTAQSVREPEPRIFNVSIETGTEYWSYPRGFVVAKSAGGSKEIVVATAHEVYAVYAGWTYDLVVDQTNYVYAQYRAMEAADLDGDGVDEVIILTDKFLCALNVENGSEIFKTPISLPSNYKKIMVGDVVRTGGKEIMIWSTYTYDKDVYIFTQTGGFIGDILVASDYDYVVSVAIEDFDPLLTGDELCLITSNVYYYGWSYYEYEWYFTVVNIWNVSIGKPPKEVLEEFIDIFYNRLSGTYPGNVHCAIQFADLTNESGKEIVLVAASEDSPYDVIINVRNASGQNSMYWTSTHVTFNRQHNWVSVSALNVTTDKDLEVVVGTSYAVTIFESDGSSSNATNPYDISLRKMTFYQVGSNKFYAVVPYTNDTSEHFCVGILNVSDVLYGRFTFVANRTVTSVTTYTPSVLIEDMTVYSFGGGRIIYLTVSGTSIGTPTIKHLEGYSSIGYEAGLNVKLWSHSRAKAIAYDGTLIGAYNASLDKEIIGVYLVDFNTSIPGYELEVVEAAGRPDGEYKDTYVTIVSGTAIIGGPYHVAIPAYDMYGVFIAPPLSGEQTTTVVIVDSDGYYYFGSLNLETGTITVGVSAESSSKPRYDGLVSIYSRTYYVFHNSNCIYLVGPDGAIAQKRSLGTIYDVIIQNLDDDPDDEIVIRYYDYYYDYCIMVLDDGFSVSKYVYWYGWWVSTPIVYDILPEFDGPEIIYYADGYIRIYNYMWGFDVRVFDVVYGNYKLVMSIPPRTEIGDVIMCLAKFPDVYVVRITNESSYDEAYVDTWVEVDIGEFSSMSIVVAQEQTDSLFVAMLGMGTGRRMLISAKYMVDLEDPEISYSSADLVRLNATDLYAVTNYSFSMTISAEDDSGLEEIDATIRYYDLDGNLIDTDSRVWEFTEMNKSVSLDVLIEAPNETYIIDIETTVYDIAGRSDYFEMEILVDSEAPVLVPCVPDRIRTKGDTYIKIAVFAGDDVYLRRIYVLFDNMTTPMIATAEDVEPGPGKYYYYEADVYVEKFDGNKTLRIVAEDYVGKVTIYEIIVECHMAVYERPQVQVGIGIGVLAIILGAIALAIRRHSPE